MLPIRDLKLGFNDAVNYRRRENKDDFNRLFIKNSKLDEIMLPQNYFLIGDKGTGKTAYAVWLSNNFYCNTLSSLNYIRETEYQKFVTLKQQKNLSLSDYTNIWKVILLLLISKKIYETEGQDSFLNRFVRFRAVNNAIDEYYDGAFSPEIMNAMEFVEHSSASANLIAECAAAEGMTAKTVKFTEQKYQTNLLYIHRRFEEAIKSLKLEKNHTLFVDGIDLRPSGIDYPDYLECVKGLANAVWSLNNDFFAPIKDSRGRIKVVILLRPDIFNSIGLQNANNRIRDNSVFLDWRIPYERFQNSELYKLPNRLLSLGQPGSKNDNYWEDYFPYTVDVQGKKEHSFISFLRFSYFRPRDIVTMLNLLRELHIEHGRSRNYFIEDDFRDVQFRRRYSEYLLGEVKDHLSFYYSESDYETFLKFFEFLKGDYSFSYFEYKQCFSNYLDFLDRNSIKRPVFLGNDAEFLQFLYELNIIFCIEQVEEGRPYFFWCFRDRSVSNINPRVKTDCQYEIFYGLGKALNTGKQFKKT
ncbi:P-loop ATPase, Sll1717 family [Alcanivorax sp. S71-1-4]|uniref:P-loop ATPase, Sll1717 family n=1 Tax=Alcanivorax sp. S71-1-4 TaxID=1177159 RepID=UPI0013576A94|nr:funZ protein [Alcanivorax sp. S71-1-4]